jgi:hypothetical protein
VISDPAHYSSLSSATASYSIMSDTDSDANSISDSSNAHSYDDDDDDGDEDSMISFGVRALCDQLRANDPRVLDHNSVFVRFQCGGQDSECERIEVFQALKENTSVKHIRLWLHGYNKSSTVAATKYLESSKTLQSIQFGYDGYYQELPAVISLLFSYKHCLAIHP